jgi:hypothetical protein
MKPLIALTLVLIAPCANARDREETCSLHTITGTTTTDCRRLERKPTHCESHTSITGTT